MTFIFCCSLSMTQIFLSFLKFFNRFLNSSPSKSIYSVSIFFFFFFRKVIDFYSLSPIPLLSKSFWCQGIFISVVVIVGRNKMCVKESLFVALTISLFSFRDDNFYFLYFFSIHRQHYLWPGHQFCLQRKNKKNK